MRSLIVSLLIVVFTSPVAFGDFPVGGDRPVDVYEPANLQPDIPAPLLILLHAYAFPPAADGMEGYWGARSAADERGLLLAYPDGTREASGDRRQFWNATDACCNFVGSPVDDSAYLRGLVDEIEAMANVDPDRIFFAGLSNGGFMSHRMACDHADKVAAIASQAGATFLNANDCAPSSPVHVLQIHGESDEDVDYEGGLNPKGVPYPGARETVAQWAEANGCSGEPEPLDLRLDIDSTRAGAETNILRYTGCREGGSAELWTIEGGPHVSNLVSNGGSTNIAVLVMDWLLAHPKRPSPKASFTLESEEGVAPLELSVDGSGSTAPARTTLDRYLWDFGDGTTKQGREAWHTYVDPGIYDVALVVVTDDGRVSLRASRSVTVTCPASDTTLWISSDVGDPVFPGTARHEGAEDGEGFQICAGGKGVASSGDELFFLYQAVEGDFRLTAQVPEMPEHGGPMAGVMVRENLEPTASFAATLLDPAPFVKSYRFAYREEAGGPVGLDKGEELETGGWVRIERSGDVFSGASSPDGYNWVPIEERVIEGAEQTMLAGIAVASRDRQLVQILLTDVELAFEGAPAFVRGDANADGEINIADPIHLLTWLFASSLELPCRAAGNANGEGLVDIADASYLLNFLFSDGPRPPPPFPDCGPSTLPADEALGCETPPESCVALP